MKTKIRFVRVVICLAGLCLSCSSAPPKRPHDMSPTPSRVARLFIELMNSENPAEEQKKLLSQRYLSELRIKEELKVFGPDLSTFAMTVRQFGGVEFVKVQDEIIAGDEAEVVAVIVLNRDAVEVRMPFELIKESGVWKINAVDLSGEPPQPEEREALPQEGRSVAPTT